MAVLIVVCPAALSDTTAHSSPYEDEYFHLLQSFSWSAAIDATSRKEVVGGGVVPARACSLTTASCVRISASFWRPLRPFGGTTCHAPASEPMSVGNRDLALYELGLVLEVVLT